MLPTGSSPYGPDQFSGGCSQLPFVVCLAAEKVVRQKTASEAFFDAEIVDHHTRAELGGIGGAPTLVAENSIPIDKQLDTTKKRVMLPVVLFSRHAKQGQLTGRQQRVD